MAELMNVRFSDLKDHDDAGKRWEQILDIGGFGDIGKSDAGGLDISGLSESKQARIRKIVAGSEPEAEAVKPAKKDGK